MAKVISHLRRLRLEYAAKLGRPVPLHEIAKETDISRNRMTSLELGQFDRISNDELLALSEFYTKKLDRLIAVGELLEIDPNNKRALDQRLVLQP